MGAAHNKNHNSFGRPGEKKFSFPRFDKPNLLLNEFRISPVAGPITPIMEIKWPLCDGRNRQATFN